MAERDFSQRGGARVNRLRFGDDSGLRERFRNGDMALNTLRMTRTRIMLLVDGIEEQGSHEFAVVDCCLRLLTVVWQTIVNHGQQL
jgi:hypothetical protein